MAEKKPKKTSIKKSLVNKSPRKVQTVRERTASGATEKPKRIRKAAGKARVRASKAKSFGRKEYHLPLPDNKAGRILGKRVRLVPKFVREAFEEIRQVTWPNRSETIRLTIAVFIFAIVFSAFVGILDYIYGELFQRFIVNSNR